MAPHPGEKSVIEQIEDLDTILRFQQDPHFDRIQRRVLNLGDLLDVATREDESTQRLGLDARKDLAIEYLNKK